MLTSWKLYNGQDYGPTKITSLKLSDSVIYTLKRHFGQLSGTWGSRIWLHIFAFYNSTWPYLNQLYWQTGSKTAKWPQDFCWHPMRSPSAVWDKVAETTFESANLSGDECCFRWIFSSVERINSVSHKETFYFLLKFNNSSIIRVSRKDNFQFNLICLCNCSNQDRPKGRAQLLMCQVHDFRAEHFWKRGSAISHQIDLLSHNRMKKLTKLKRKLNCLFVTLGILFAPIIFKLFFMRQN